MIAHEDGTRTIEKKKKNISDPLLKDKHSFYPELSRLMSGSNLIESLIRSLRSDVQHNKDVFVKTDSHYKKLKIEEIYFIEALSDYVNIYTKEKRYTIHSTLYSIFEKLPKADYIRIHRSYIVRLDRITAIEDHFLFVEDRQIPIGKTYRHEVMSRLTIFQ